MPKVTLRRPPKNHDLAAWVSGAEPEAPVEEAPPKTKKKRLAIYLDPEVLRTLRLTSGFHEVSMSEIVENALRAEFKANPLTIYP